MGKAIARALAGEGVNVAICARGLEDLENAAAEIARETGARILPVQADMKGADDITRMVAAAVKEFGGLDILVNNAASTIHGSVLELADEAWYNRFDGKVMGYIRCARAAVPHMIKRGGSQPDEIPRRRRRQARHLGQLRPPRRHPDQAESSSRRSRRTTAAHRPGDPAGRVGERGGLPLLRHG